MLREEIFRTFRPGLKLPLVLGGASIVATVLFGYFGMASADRDRFWSLVSLVGGLKTIVLLTVLGLFCFRIWVVSSKLSTLEESLNPPKHKLRIRRFEDISLIEYGHINYRPFLFYRDGYPEGVGPAILRWICGKEIRLEQLNEKTTWDTFLDELERGRYDILATLLFETANRCSKVAFSRPLFFSDIGIYVSKEHEFWEGRLTSDGLPFAAALTLLNSVKGKLAARVIEGELSERLAKKHLSRAELTIVPQDRASIPGLIDSVGHMGIRSDVVFAEAIQADRTRSVRNGKVVNILAPYQLLYPVGFAIRRQEYILRHFINLRIFDLEDAYPGGIYALLDTELEQAGMKMPRAQIRRYYVRSPSEVPSVPDVIPFERPHRGNPP